MIPDTRHFGFLWEFYISSGFKGGNGETEWRTHSDGDGEFVVYHYEEPTFALFEFGGRGDRIWDVEHGVYNSPLEAMYAARKIQNVRDEEWAKLEDQMRNI